MNLMFAAAFAFPASAHTAQEVMTRMITERGHPYVFPVPEGKIRKEEPTPKEEPVQQQDQTRDEYWSRPLPKVEVDDRPSATQQYWNNYEQEQNKPKPHKNVFELLQGTGDSSQ